MFYYKARYTFGFSFLALSVDHPISKYFEHDEKFINFRKECSKTGTTEESIAHGEKIGFKTNLIAINPFDEEKKSLYSLLTLF